MKTRKILLIALVVSLPAGAFCQLEKGSMLNSASAGISFQTATQSSGTASYSGSVIDFSLNDGLGFFVANNLALGPGLAFNVGSRSSRNSGSPLAPGSKDQTTYYSVSIDPFVRYYFVHQKKSGVFGQISATAGYSQQFQTYQNGNSPEQKDTYNSLMLGGSIAAGYVYFINPNIGVESSLGYRLLSYTSTYSGSTDRNMLGTLTLNVGFSIYIGK